MSRHVVLLVIFLCYYNIMFVDRAQCTRNLSKEEVLDMEIKGKYGNIDCVDVNKQIAFQHPLLKNHIINFQKISTLLHNRQHNISTTSTFSEAYLKAEMCPVGTIPVRRIRKMDHTKYFKPFSTFFAVAGTKTGPDRYTGARGNIKTYNPSATDHQYTAARIRLYADYNIIEAGWRVDPDLNGDSQTRLYISTEMGETHCLNLLCAGFIHTNNIYPIDCVIASISKPGGPIYELPVNITRDNENGNWYLIIGAKDENIVMGYWPPEVFTGMVYRVQWGGAAYAPPGKPLPPMGSGTLVRGDFNDDAYVSNIIVLDVGEVSLDPDIRICEDDSELYNVRDGGHYKDNGHTMFFGGPGHF